MSKEFRFPVLMSCIGLVVAACLPMWMDLGAEAIPRFIFIVLVLSVLEVSISLDNAVVNAKFLKDLSPVWRARFMSWGIWIAVFGMRFVFPLAVVCIVAHLSPWQALQLVSLDPHRYAEIMHSVHHQVSSFGGVFLALVALKYFVDHEKESHWIHWLEVPLSKLGRLEAIEVGIVLTGLFFFSKLFEQNKAHEILAAGVAGVLVWLAVDLLNAALDLQAHSSWFSRAGLGGFIYLELLDASFSFDGVVGAMAVTSNFYLIALGLGIGAFFVRALTLSVFERGTLESYRFLEMGAFYAVASLAVMMFAGILFEIPEIVTGLLSASIVVISVFASRSVDTSDS